MATYEVFVTNIGCVYCGSDKLEATKTYDAYVLASHDPCGRAGGESVTMIIDSQEAYEYTGSLYSADN